MSLANKDLEQIRLVVREETTSIVDSKLRERLNPLEGKIDTISGRLQAIEADVKEIYHCCPV